MKRVKLVKQDYHYECGDGCCSEYQITWYVDGEVVHSSSCEDSGWLAVLKHLGIEASLVVRNNDGEDVLGVMKLTEEQTKKKNHKKK